MCERACDQRRKKELGKELKSQGTGGLLKEKPRRKL